MKTLTYVTLVILGGLLGYWCGWGDGKKAGVKAQYYKQYEEYLEKQQSGVELDLRDSVSL